MRRLVVLGVLMLAAPAIAAEPMLVLMDWSAGSVSGGAPLAVDGVTSARFPFEAGACHRRLHVDVHYSPDRVAVDAPGVGGATLLFRMRIDVLREGVLVGSSNVSGVQDDGTPRYSALVATTPAAGAHDVVLHLREGAPANVSARVRGWSVPGELACLPRVVVGEVEANPAGPDDGNEWVELWNLDKDPVDLSFWTLRTTHGETVDLVLPSGTVLLPGEALVVAFAAGQALDNEDESVVLLDAFGTVRDATPARSDAANDARTWQRDGPEATTWQFLPGTPGFRQG